jgi:hypothetical protein
MLHSPSSKLTYPQLVKKFPAFYGTRMFITAFTRARHLFLPRATASISKCRNSILFSIVMLSKDQSKARPSKLFCNVLRFYGEDLLAPRPTPKLEDYPLSTVRDCLLSIFAAVLHIRWPLLPLQPEDAPRCGDNETLT